MGWEIDVERETKWRTNDDEITTVNNTFCCCCLHTQFALAHEAFACKSLLACFLCFFLSLLLSCFLPFSLFLHHSLPYPPPPLSHFLSNHLYTLCAFSFPSPVRWSYSTSKYHVQHFPITHHDGFSAVSHLLCFFCCSLRNRFSRTYKMIRYLVDF